MSRQHLEMALKSYDDQVDQLDVAQRDIDRYKTENKILLSEVAAAVSEVEELRAKLKHVESVMAARVVTAACDIVEENSRKALESMRDKIKDKFKDLFNDEVKPAAERVKKAADQVIKLDYPEPIEGQHFEVVDPYAPPRLTPKEKAKLVSTTAPLNPPSFLKKKQTILQPDGFPRRAIMLLFGG